MLGAILGDIIGSRFEFDRGGKTKEFELFTDDCDFTDDTVMTIAVADALTSSNHDNEEELKNDLIKSMQYWGKKYPYAGYGASFIYWLDNPIPYGSYGNGSAMRVSPVGWLYETIEETRRVARISAEVSHNHIEGIKGAECTASVIYLARTKHNKEEIKEYIDREFGYDYSETLEEMRQRHEHIETCMDSLPKALRSFFDGKSYEDVIRNAISLGGDTDTLAAIAGAMGEAYYDIPDDIKSEGMKFIPNEFVEVINRFEEEIIK